MYYFSKQMQMYYYKGHHRYTYYNHGDNSNNLHLGCGSTYHPCFDNVDLYPFNDDIIKRDLFSKDWNLPKDSYDYIYSNHFFEHIPDNDSFFNVMENLYNYTRNGSIIELRVPYPSIRSLITCTHYRVIDVKSFSYWLPKRENGTLYKSDQTHTFLKLLERIPHGNYHFKKYLKINMGPFYALSIIFTVVK